MNDSVGRSAEGETGHQHKTHAGRLPAMRAQEQDAHAHQHDQCIEYATDRPSEGDQISVVGNGLNQPVRGEGMKGVHDARAKQRESDDGSRHIAFGRVMNEGHRNREYRRAEGAPFQNRMSEASGQEPMHTVGQHAVGPVAGGDGVEGGLR